LKKRWGGSNLEGRGVRAERNLIQRLSAPPVKIKSSLTNVRGVSAKGVTWHDSGPSDREAKLRKNELDWKT